MAQYMIGRELERVGLADLAMVDSAGIERWEAGSRIDARAAAVLAAHGIDPIKHRARQLHPEWLVERDLVLALDNGHLDAMRRMMADENEASKIQLLRSFDPASPADGAKADLSIADPWYGNLANFEVTWDQINAALPGIVAFVRSQVADREEERA